MICTEPFISSAENMSLAHGFEGYHFAVMPHPIGSSDLPTLEGWADDVVEQVIGILTEKPFSN